MKHDARTVRRAGVTFVSVTVENTAERPRRVRVQNALDGAVWPPRTNGVPDHGWTDGEYASVLAAGERRALGYATDAPPSSPAILVDAADASAVERGLDPVRDLPDPRPPRDVFAGRSR